MKVGAWMCSSDEGSEGRQKYDVDNEVGDVEPHAVCLPAITTSTSLYNPPQHSHSLGS